MMNKLLVSMSGGVDSSVATALLKEMGCHVEGAFMRFWDCSLDERADGRRCCSPGDMQDAAEVCRRLGIPFHHVDAQQSFRRTVVEHFVEEYLKGRTPNPCVLCNQWMKFGLLLEKALQMGLEGVATGHYARVRYDRTRGRYLLLGARDASVDQSYFLFSLTQEQLGRACFPAGEYSKEQIRNTARAFGLHVASKTKSQEICFIPDNDYRGFILRYNGEQEGKEGDIIDRSGDVLGRHKGLFRFTVGQRKGIGIPSRHPYYVMGMDVAANRLIVGRREELLGVALVVEGVNWIAFEEPPALLRAKVKVRYRHAAADATLTPLSYNKVKVRFDKPQWAITPGQAAVFYQEDMVLGGGWIRERIDA